jgi:hypothetical protein
MEKIYLPLTSELKDPLDYISAADADGILCLHEYTEEGHDVSYPTLETAMSLMKLNYGEPNGQFDFQSHLDGYDTVAQLIWEKTPLSRQELEDWLESSYLMGFNPLPVLRQMLGEDIPVLFTSSGTGFSTDDPEFIGKLYIWVKWDGSHAEVGLGMLKDGTSEGHSVDSTTATESEAGEAELAAAVEEKVEFDVPELSGE